MHRCAFYNPDYICQYIVIGISKNSNYTRLQVTVKNSIGCRPNHRIMLSTIDFNNKHVGRVPTRHYLSQERHPAG